MSIGFILLLGLNAFLFFNYIDDLTHLGNIIDRISCRLNAAVDLIDNLNKRVENIEKEKDETKGTS